MLIMNPGHNSQVSGNRDQKAKLSCLRLSITPSDAFVLCTHWEIWKLTVPEIKITLEKIGPSFESDANCSNAPDFVK
jgi:hypothetical protein